VGWCGRTGCIGGDGVGVNCRDNQPVMGHWLEDLVDAVKDCIKLSNGMT